MADGNHEAWDERIALLRRQISDLTQQAAAASGSAWEERLADQINESRSAAQRAFEAARRDASPFASGMLCWVVADHGYSSHSACSFVGVLCLAAVLDRIRR
jgi:hypothetical protein